MAVEERSPRIGHPSRALRFYKASSKEFASGRKSSQHMITSKLKAGKKIPTTSISLVERPTGEEESSTSSHTVGI